MLGLLVLTELAERIEALDVDLLPTWILTP